MVMIVNLPRFHAYRQVSSALHASAEQSAPSQAASPKACALMRTSRSTRLRDMSPRVRPDMSPAKQTRATHITKYTQNIVSQHGTSFAAMTILVLIDRNTCNRPMRVSIHCLD